MASTGNSSQSLTNTDRSNSKPGPWRVSISAPLCAFCNKTVYPAEELIAAGQKFHKLCLKCGNFILFIIQSPSKFSIR